MNQSILAIREKMQRESVSERGLSEAVGIARGTLRNFLADKWVALEPLLKALNYFDQSVVLASFPNNSNPISSTVAISFKILRDGADSWKIHLMNMVDEFRASLDMRLILLPPPKELPLRLQVLIAATVIELCYEVKVSPPVWALELPPLREPWFVSEMNSLMASALLESPPGFRSKNIFVLDNFLQRA